MNDNNSPKYPVFLNNIAVVVVIIFTIVLGLIKGGGFFIGCFLVYGMLYARNRINFEGTLTQRELHLELLEEKIKEKEQLLLKLSEEDKINNVEEDSNKD